MKKLFGGLNITWPKLVIFAVIAGVYTAVMALIPAAEETSFADITKTFEVWVLFGMILITNSKTPLDSALKCFVFFLISQPLVYLIQVPFCWLGWEIFRYYPPWFIWTLLTFPMGWAGFYMRKEKWWGMLILAPMLCLVAYLYEGFLREMISFFPNHLLTSIFCIATVIIYPLVVFKNKKLRLTGLIISLVLIVAATVWGLAGGRNTYNTILMSNNGSMGVSFDDSYTVYLEDEEYGTVAIDINENLQDYVINAQFIKTGETKLILEAPDGEKRVFSLVIERSSYDLEEIGDEAEPETA